jgi:hypothetical protein
LKKILLLVVLVFVVFVVFNRDRLFLRDPLGSVTRDGVKVEGVQVYINAKNDVLLEKDSAPAFVTVIQHGNHVGTPKTVPGLHWMVYMADADVWTVVQEDTNAVVESMTGKSVVVRDGKTETVVSLR